MKSLLRSVYETSPQDIYRYFAKRRRARRTVSFIDRYIATHPVRKLHIGCGGNCLDTWLNTDLQPDNKEIVLLDAGKPFQLPSNAFDYIFSEHLIEHLNHSQQVNFLRESFRILKPGGRIRIATPDFDFLMKLGHANRSTFENTYLRWNFKTFLHHIPPALMNDDDIEVYVVNNYFRDWGHQFIHNKISLKHLIEYSGFAFEGFQKVGTSTDPMLTALEKHGAMITDTYNEYETMVAEAVKLETPVKHAE